MIPKWIKFVIDLIKLKIQNIFYYNSLINLTNVGSVVFTQGPPTTITLYDIDEHSKYTHCSILIWFFKMFAFSVFRILLTRVLFWIYIQKHLILSFMVLSVYFILLLLKYTLYFITHLREKCVKQNIPKVYYKQKFVPWLFCEQCRKL